MRENEAATARYTSLLGTEPTFVASDTEARWELAEHRSLFVEEHAEHAGHAVRTILVDDLDVLVAQIAAGGIEPDKRETYQSGVRKALHRDPDGNKIEFGAARCGPQRAHGTPGARAAPATPTRRTSTGSVPLVPPGSVGAAP